MPAPSTPLEGCIHILKETRSLVVSTGAGISKESGIPTFRDAPNALWAKYDPETLASPEGFMRDPALVWRWYGERREMIASAEPNPGHRAIAELETLCDEFLLITQNIDNLHRLAGSQNVVEIHGNVFRNKCFDRGHPVETLPEDDHVPPRCHCGSLIRPDVVWFGEMLPEDGMNHASLALARCDAILVVGTSGTVYPAAGFAAAAMAQGARVIAVNPEETPITENADVFLKGNAGDILPRVVSELKTALSK